ncbi:MAG: WD40 repeat domain-containing protein [Blastocatellia bacterium]
MLQQLHRTRFLAVVGSSGRGKSSLIRAGLIPKLKAGFLIEDRDLWLTAKMKPGDSPIRNLAASLLEAAPADGEVDGFVGAIRSNGVRAIIERLMPALAGADNNLLLFIDQFEEIFRFGVKSGKPEQRAEAEDFVSIMLALAEQRSLPIYVVMTMRSDFLGDCDNFYGLPEAMNRSQYLVPRLTRQQRQQAIEGPIRLFGGSISPRLLDRVLNDVGDKSDQLPVTQHALMRTWEEWEREATERRRDGETERRRDGGTERDDNPQSQSPNPQSIQVDLPHFEAAGGIKDALSKDAEAALDGMDADELKITERMFQALTDTDAHNRRVRRPAHLSDIEAITGASRETVLKIIERFKSGGRSFLIVPGGADPQIDISHESLIRQWERMSEWVNNEKDSRDMYLRLVDAARKRRELWRGVDLQEALQWRKRHQPNAAWAKRYDEDKTAFDQAIRYLERSHKTQIRRRLSLITMIVTAFVVLSGLTLYAWQLQGKAKQQEEIANAQALNARQFYYAANMNLAQEAYENIKFSRLYDLLNTFLPSRDNQQFAPAREFYWYYLWRAAHHETQTLKGHESSGLSVAFSPDGKTLASAGGDREKKDFAIRLRFAATDEEVARHRAK